MSRRILGLAIFAVLLALPARRASADPTDLFGFGPKAMATAGASAPVLTDWSSAAANAAGPARAGRVDLGLGYVYGHAFARVNGRDAGLMDVRGIALGLAAPIRLPKGLVLGVGLAAYVPDQFLVRVQLIPSYEPRFVMLDNRPHRLVVTPVVALKVWRALSLGLGATILGDAAGRGVRFSVGTLGGGKSGEANLDVDLPMRVAPVAGILFGPLGGFSVGIAYQGELDLRLALDIVADVNVAGVVTGDTVIAMRAVNYFTPHRVSVTAAYRWWGLQAAATLVYKAWSRFSAGIPDLRITMDLGLAPPFWRTVLPPDNFHDTIYVRLGGRWTFDLGRGRSLSLSAGYGFEPTPVPAQVGVSALLDNDRHVVGMGLAYEMGRLSKTVPWTLGVELAVQYHHLVERRDSRSLEWGGLGGLVYGGDLVFAGLAVRVGM